MNEINSPILTIPGISYRMGAMIIAEVGDFAMFDSPDKVLAYAGAVSIYISVWKAGNESKASITTLQFPMLPKKLVRLIFALEKSGQPYLPAA